VAFRSQRGKKKAVCEEESQQVTKGPKRGKEITKVMRGCLPQTNLCTEMQKTRKKRDLPTDGMRFCVGHHRHRNGIFFSLAKASRNRARSPLSLSLTVPA
jgi:hypothetical protein